MSKILFNRPLFEHSVEDISSIESLTPSVILFKNKPGLKCIEIIKNENIKNIYSGFYIGVDWILKNEIAVYIAPKIDKKSQQTDYLKMLHCFLKNPEITCPTRDLYEIKFEKPYIEIEQNQDLLTPLLVIQFLQILKSIVRKGLKKSYYKIEKNLNAKIKGKVIVSQTLKQNILNNRTANTYCRFEEFGYNCTENRILKRTLVFIQRYLALFPEYARMMSQTINYCSPAFHEVDGNIDTNKIKSIKNNSFYKEYEEGLYVANLILKRFGYNIKGIENLKSRIIKVPPFWVDMPKLFELYVLGLLKEKYSNQIKFQVQGVYGKPDFILSDSNNKMIIDAKYKPYYCNSFAALDQWKRDMVISDIRQLSGYSRDKKILSKLGLTTPEEQEKAIDCLIIYPDQSGTERLKGNLKGSRIDGFINFYKMGVKLPVIEDNLHESEEKKIKQTAD